MYSENYAIEESKKYFDGDELAAKVFVDKYALRDKNDNLLEKTPDDMHHRIAKELYRIEKKKFKEPISYEEIYNYLKDFKHIIPQGSGLSGIGNNHRYVSLSNCYVVKSPYDSYSSICKTDEELVNIAKRRGGTGVDISKLRPKGTPTSNASKSSTGIVPFCERFSNSIREVGQCLHFSTKVLTKNGLKNIEDVEEGEKVHTKKGWIKVNKKIKNKKPCLKIKTINGREIICSKDHVFQTPQGERRVEELKEGDGINRIIGEGWDGKEDIFKINDFIKELEKEEQINLPKKINKNIAYFLGFLYRNAQVYDNKIEFIFDSKPIDFEEKVINVAQKMKCNYEKIVDGKKRLVKIIVQSKALIEFLKYNKILKQNKRIFFPEAILQSRKENLFSFLYAYFNTMERFFNINTFDNDEKNEEFLLMAQNVLDAIGINSKIKYNENNKVFIILNNKSIKDYIKSIEDYKNSIEQHTYDLCLEDEHLFFANGLYAHNSGRRGALIITLSIHHPEIMNFIQMKKDLNKVTGANISVKLTDEFLKAVQQDKEYEQRWPVDSDNPKISKKVKAKDIWDEIVDGAWSSAEPGVLFFDNIIKESPADCYSDFGYKTTSVNPCSELPLSERDSCRLLLLNLYGYVDNPFTKKATFNFDKFYKHSQIAQRFMDDIVDLETECVTNIIKKVKDDPEPMEVKRDELNLWQQVRKFCKEGRRTGTGVNAVGDMLAALGYQYGSEKSIKFLDKVFRTLKLGCYRSSVDMAKELGAFKIWDYNLEKNNPFLLRIKDEDAKLYKDMKQYGRRNIACLTMAPSGSVSILTQTTSGVEPLFQMSYKRRKKVTDEKDTKVDFIDETGDKWHEFEVIHPRIKQWKEITKKDDIKESPWYGCCANDIDWKSRVKLQGKINKNIDHSISSTLNLPKTATKKDVATIYKAAWEYDCKGITVYRDGCRSGVMINDEKKEEEKINKTDAPKRPEILPCEIFHTSVKKHKYFVLVGLLCGEPYEVFAGKNDDVVKKHWKKGLVRKIQRGQYALCDASDKKHLIHKSISKFITEDQEAITRMVSTSLRHGADVNFVVHQLEKTQGDLQSFAKAVARILKKYIKNGSSIHGEECPQCGGNLFRQEGCVMCSCGWTKCG